MRANVDPHRRNQRRPHLQHAQTRRFATATVRHVVGGAGICQVGDGYVQPEINQYGVDMAAGKGSHNSMPSSHAANMFAATMVLFLFYRTTLWFMLPLALAVSLSRLYNGVHYPSDVLAGAIIGAGYAVAAAIAVESAWQHVGKKLFRAGTPKCPRSCRI